MPKTVAQPTATENGLSTSNLTNQISQKDIPASREPQALHKQYSISAPGSFSYILQGHNGKLKVLDNSTHQELPLHNSPLLQKQFRHIAHQSNNYLLLLTIDSSEVCIVGDLFSGNS